VRILKKYDLLVIGSGPGGYVAAIKAAQNDLKVGIIEKDAIGGVCLNWGCIPTKSLLKSAKIYQEFLNAKDYGIDVEDLSSIKPNWDAILKRKDRIVRRLTGGVKMLLKKNNIDIFMGEGKIIKPDTVLVNDEEIKTQNIIIATGASPILPPITGLDKAYDSGILLTSKGMLDNKSIPKKLVIIGGGVIGIEFATIFNTFGTEVTIIERENKILLNVDNEIRDAYIKTLKKAKIKVLTSSTVIKIDNENVVYKDDDDKELSIATEKILLSVGMKANLDSFSEIKLDLENKFIKVNEQMQTSQENIYAIGDVTGKTMLAHVASHQGMVAVMDILGKKEKINYNQIPAVIYSFPEIAQIGMTEEIAKENNIEYSTSVFPLQANGKAMTANETNGFIKLISSKPYNEIIGVHILADNASDLISEALMVMKLEGTADEIAKAIHPHPTISEIFHEAALGIVDKPIHI